MASKNAKIYAALKAHLETYADLPDVRYGGQSFDPPSGLGPYLIVDDLRYENRRLYQNTDGKTWHTGSLMIHSKTPIEWSDTQQAEYIGLIIDHFPQDTAMTFDDITIKVSQEPSVVNSGYRDKDMWRQTADVRWEGFV